MNKKAKGILTHVFAHSPEEKFFLMVSLFLSVLGMLCNVIPYVSVYFITKIFLTGEDRNSAIFWVFIAGGGIFLNLLFAFLGGLGCHKVAFQVLYRYRLKLMEHLGKLPLGFFIENPSGGIQKIMDENIEKLESIIAHMLPDLIGSLVVLVALFSGIAYLSWIMALTVLISVVVAFAFQFMVFGGEAAQERYAQYMKVTVATTGNFSEYVKGMAEVKLFGKGGGISKKLEQNLDECLAWEITNYRKSAFLMSMYKSIILSLLSFVIPVGGFLIFKYPMGDTVLAVIMTLIIVPALYDPLLTCIDYSVQINFTKAGLVQIENILNEPVFKTEENREIEQGNSICFEDVSFSYEDKTKPTRKMALERVSFTCKEKQMTALVGESGSGKSTIGQLLLRFWEIDKGRISIGGKDIKSIDTEDLMKKIAFVFQDTYIFSDTVRENISMNRNYSAEEVMVAAKKARCHDFIMKLPNGYDTPIGSGNIKLSGGEAQRISIARAFLKDSEIIILDEALAYADAENENLIQEAIRNLIQDKTVIVIAHRLKSIMDADKIIVLKEGKIIEEGTHRSLLEKDGEYKILWDLQFAAETWEIVGKGGKCRCEN